MSRAHLRHVVGDRAGNAIQNATVTVYLTGTSTPVNDLYTSATGGSPVSSAQLVSNNQGEVEGWLATAKTVDVQVSDNNHGAYYSGAVGETLTFPPFTETVGVVPPPEDLATQSGSNTFSSPITFLVDPVFAGPSGGPAYTAADEIITGDWTFATDPTWTGTLGAPLHQSGDETAAGIKTFSGAYTELLSARFKQGPTYNVTHSGWGAKGDGRSITDGVLSASSAVLTSASAPFTAGDQGKQVWVPDALTRTVTDANMAFNSFTLTSATANFTSDDVGRIIYVVGGETGGADLALAAITVIGSSTSVTLSAKCNNASGVTNTTATIHGVLKTTISAYTSPTSVTLAANCTKPGGVSSADVVWGTEDTTAIQSAMTAAKLVPGASVLIPPSTGMYLVSRQGNNAYCLSGGSNLRAFGGGHIKQVPGQHGSASVRVFSATSSTAFLVEDLTIEGSSDLANYTNTDEHISGVFLAGGVGCAVRRCTILNLPDAVTFNGLGQRNHVFENDISKMIRSGVNLNGTNNSCFVGNTIHDFDTTGWAFLLEMNASDPDRVGNRVIGNVCTNVPAGIELTGSTGGRPKRTVVVDNEFAISAVNYNAQAALISTAADTEFSHNTCTGGVISLARDLLRPHVVGNRIDCSTTTEDPGSVTVNGAIEIGGGSGSNIVGALIQSNEIWGHPHYGIKLANTVSAPTSPSIIRILDNTVSTCAYGGIDFVRGDDLLISRNVLNDNGGDPGGFGAGIAFQAISSIGTNRVAIWDNVFLGSANQTKGVHFNNNLLAPDTWISRNIFSATTTPISNPTYATGTSTFWNNKGVNGSGTPATLGSIAFQDVAIAGTLAVTGAVTLGSLSGTTITDATNFVLGTATGTKFGTATNQQIGFLGGGPIARPTALTQTYSTATRTHAALTSSDLTGISSSSTGSALAEPSAAYTQSEMQQNFRRLQDQVVNLRADLANAKQFLNTLADDLQSYGLEG